MALTGTERPNSPRIVNRNSNRIVIREYDYQYQQPWESEMPAIGTLQSDGYFLGYEAIRESPVYTTVQMQWGTDQSWFINFQPEDNDNVYYPESRGLETPLELHPDFLMKWTYDLWRAENFDEALQAWAGTATDASDADGKSWLWTKTNPGKGWKKMQDRTKPGKEVYLKPTFQVRQDSYHRTKADAEDQLKDCGFLVDPAEKFGYDDGDFLVANVYLNYDGKYWVATKEYLHDNQGWDTDIYSTTTTTP